MDTVAKRKHFMSFVTRAVPMLRSKKRTCYPRKWSSEDHCFFEQLIHNAQNISAIPSSLAQVIAEIVRDTSTMRSDWKKVARGLGLDDEAELKNIEDASLYRQELPIYIALTSVYMMNSAASLGTLLESLMSMKRYDILVKIKDSVQAIVHEHSELKPTTNSFSSENEPKKIAHEHSESRPIESSFSFENEPEKHPIEEDSHPDKASNHDSAFYKQLSAPSSLLEILNINDEIIKNGSDPVWKELQNNKENLFKNITQAFRKEEDLLEPTGFQFVDPTSRTPALSKNVCGKSSDKDEKELHSIGSNVCYNESSKNRVIKTCPLSAVHITDSAQTTTEFTDSHNDIDKYYDSESTCDDDLDPDLMGQHKFQEETLGTNLYGKYASLTIGDDTRRIQHDNHQHLNIADYNDTRNTQSEELIHTDVSSGSDTEAYDIVKDNTVNENIEDLVAERDALVRSVERAEREPHSIFLETPEPVKKPTDYLHSLMSGIMPPDSSITPSSIKVIVVHSEKDSDIAMEIAAALVKEFEMAAVAECQLNPVWHIDPCMFRRIALYWADVIVPLITNKWLEDVTNEKPLQQRETASLNAKAVFRILQNMFMNRGSMNLSCIPVVMEGTSCRFRNYPEIRDAISLSRDIYKNASIKRLGDFIKAFHNITKNARREAKKVLLE